MSWLSRLHGETRKLQTGASETISITSTPDGVLLEIKEDALAPKNLVSGFEKYEDGNAYAINTLVYVDTLKTYEVDGTSYVSIPGTYICVSPVPPKIEVATLSNPYLKEYYSKVTQHDGIIYAPVVIVNDTREPAFKTEDEKGKYWHLIAPAVTLNIRTCDNGEDALTYIAAQTSGSAGG